MRWLSLDHGTKKIGLAFSDELEILAWPFEVWLQEEERTLVRLARLEPHAQLDAELFGDALAARTGLPVRFVNEHLSSAEAERLLRERGVKPEKRKAMLDAAAAAVILSELLEDRRAKGIPATAMD